MLSQADNQAALPGVTSGRQRFIGFDENSLAYNRGYGISAERPGISFESGAFAGPVRPTIEGHLLEALAGGVFNHSGQFAPGAAQPRSDGRNALQTDQPAIVPPESAIHVPKAVFGGVAFDHFGHFLLETTARLWCLDEYKTLPWLFLTDGQAALKPYQVDFLQLLGLAPEQIIPVASWHQIDELIIPEPGFVYHHKVSRAYRDIFRRPVVAPAREGRKIYLSRGNTTIARTIGEAELQAFLALDGWDIICPETLPAAEQAALFRDDNILLGLQGSAMHLGLFAPDARRVVHLCRGLGYRGYYILDDLTAADATYLNAMRSHELPSKPIEGPFLLDLDKTIAFLRSEELVAPRKVAAGAPVSQAALEHSYAGWWYYTESQVRFHHQTAHDQSPVTAGTALDSALRAVELCPGERLILCHALAMLLKFASAEEALALADKYGGTLTTAQTAEDAQLFYYLSLIYDQRGQYAQAEAAAAQAVAKISDNASYVHQLSSVLFRLERLEEAEALLQGLIARNLAVAANFVVMSLICSARNDQPGAIAWAQKAVSANAADETTLRRLGDLLMFNHRRDEAVAMYREFAAHHKVSLKFHLDMYEIERAGGELDKAAEHVLQLYWHQPDDDDIAAKAAAILLELDQLPDLSALEVMPFPAVQEQAVMIYQRSLALMGEGATRQALQVAGIAVKMFPQNDTIMGHLLSLMLGTGRGLEARLLVDILHGRGRRSGMLSYVQSLIESGLGRWDAAREAAREAAALEPDNSEIVSHFNRFAAIPQTPATELSA